MKNIEYVPNVIYYGPPGTGKTREIQVKHLNGSENVNSKFITFHQSYSYEEFVEGIKPSLSQSKVVLFTNTILTQFVELVFKELIAEFGVDIILKNASIKKKTINSIDYTSYSIDEFFRSTILLGCFDEMQKPENFQTGKNSTARFYYKELFIIDGKYFYLSNQWYGNGIYDLHIDNLKLFVDSVTKGVMCIENKEGEYSFSKKLDSSNVIYNLQKGVFYDACESAAILAGYTSLASCIKDSKENRFEKFKTAISSNNFFVLCIDEINRANISAVFGEIITLIESGKRLGAEEEIFATLPYSKELFGVPGNLIVVGTMNTADRSITLLDSALRRRFSFKEILPNADLLSEIVIDKIEINKLLEKINKRITYFLGKDQSIGHSYFLGLKASKNPKKDLLSVFFNNIIPLLEEYFYNDIAKIRLVLGEGNKNHNESFYVKVEEGDIDELFGILEGDLDLEEGQSYFVKNNRLIKLALNGEEDMITNEIFSKIYN